eukprot:SAG25_NODE_272_length_10613_cov_6.416191_20_plen_150_part_00
MCGQDAPRTGKGEAAFSESRDVEQATTTPFYAEDEPDDPRAPRRRRGRGDEAGEGGGGRAFHPRRDLRGNVILTGGQPLRTDPGPTPWHSAEDDAAEEAARLRRGGGGSGGAARRVSAPWEATNPGEHSKGVTGHGQRRTPSSRRITKK